MKIAVHGFRRDLRLSDDQTRHVPEADTLAYPAPIVDHARQRLKTLALFRKLP